MSKQIDELLKQALSPVEQPGSCLNERTLERVKEMEHMKAKKGKAGRLPMAAAIAAAVFVLGSGSVYAAWRYLTPAQVAQENEMSKLAKAFESDDAVMINEKQTAGGYTVSLLGVASGKNLSEYVEEGDVKDDKTYVVAAIEKEDGSPMPDTDSEAYGEETFFMSPLIKGMDPNMHNAVTMGGGYAEFVQDGILYRLVECDNVEIFADKGLYFSVNEGAFYDQQAYGYDEATGEITRNEAYDGLNALFVLPIDASKGDPEAAKAYLEEWEKSMERDEAEDEAEIPADIEEFMNRLYENPENLELYADRIESTVQVLTPDKEGYVAFSYELEDGTAGEGEYSVGELFPDKKAGTIRISGWSGGETLDSMVIDVFTLNEDGTVTYAVYVPKME